jgi:CRISPR type III-A-associated RAMP protein Csm4
MDSGLLVRLQPAGPWRFGSDSGQRNDLAPIYHSDTLYSAVTSAMAALGMLEEWLEATALASPASAVRFSSCFPWQGDTLYVAPPQSVWPPAAAKLRTKGVRFVPLSLVGPLLAGAPLEEGRWVVDGQSGCLLPGGGEAPASGPFRTASRAFAAVDRLAEGSLLPHRTACLEFCDGAGLWSFVAFNTEEAKTRWSGPVEGAFRLLADSGFGGRRTIGWGRSTVPEVLPSSLPELLPPERKPVADEPESDEGEAPAKPETAYWLLSLFSPGREDTVDWQRGSYSLITRGGRIESPGRWGEPKKLLRMVEEGSVLFAGSPPAGTASDVAPDGFPHPVFRYGFALSIPIPAQVAS